MQIFLLLATLASAAEPATLHERADALGIAWPPPKPALHVDKSERTLTFSSAGVAVKTYRVGLGGSPVGDKVRQGDQRTPTGSFTIVTRNAQSAFYLFMGISYPNAEDAERGLKAGLITAEQAKAIREASAAGRVPPWNTALGGAIGVHGNGGDEDWTLGCMAIEDAEVKELWEVVPYGTPITIEE